MLEIPSYSYYIDAEVRFVAAEYSIGEENGSLIICVASGVMDGFEVPLTVTLTTQDGTAC